MNILHLKGCFDLVFYINNKLKEVCTNESLTKRDFNVKSI